MQFRQKALSKLQSPEELDLPVRFARPQGRLVLAVTVVVMAVAGFWAFTGSVSSKLSAPGILTHAEGSYMLQSPFAGQVTAVSAKEGQLLTPGAPLLQVRTERGDQTVRVVAGGRVTTLVAKMGSVLTTGADVATVERVQSPDDPLVAMLYVPGGSGAAIPVGASVDLSVQSAPRQQFGVLRGRVKAVGRAPQTPGQISGFLGDSRLAAQYSKQGNPVAVLVQLEHSSTTKSGYRWSSTDGPPYAVDSTTPVTAAVHLAAQRPIDWLLP
ncbi:MULTISPECIES: HlyD family efflux transporter periplasmic adaptor subunit [unclassified Streptomyces]|uniref:HlyD family efflux transporter periplasmic adaptor subunit n=1 Tax=unclassified Streptomyces TaxID=2593676 RepID=UPI001BED3883|nr:MULTISPECIES: HlyD family efflux transporter periplasmic adaptor subunit [unclassified Streptomyces]MBT2406466.1 HlyD family efflux transporter periplasmic adaptor subunit [Streptomyces sp. ISL-21]MBT2455595.1 HlyD family efflux transporter periplasmic adaptor subunit [Streptomyces sp. ISL-86]MBT2612460.1 HlyD family efflux transporter periplasmic adaptor subunit [Streptomyces sp. ISL-87]